MTTLIAMLLIVSSAVTFKTMIYDENPKLRAYIKAKLTNPSF